MDKDNSDVSAKVLLEIKEIAMHRFVNNKKSLFTSGNCKIAKIDHNNGSTVYFINLNSFYYTLRKDIPFIKLTYDETVSYLFPHFQNGLSTVTLAKNAPVIHNLEEILTNAAILTDYATAMDDASLRNKIETHCPNIAKQPVSNPDQIKEVISTTGKLLNTAFTTIGGFIKQGVGAAGEFINNKLAPGENSNVNPETKQKWENLKKGTNDFLTMSVESYNTYVDPYVKPIVEKGKKTYNQTAENINKSQNPNVKYIKELADTSQKALGQAFQGLLKGGKQIGGELSTQTKKIVQKKYGDDYVKTFIDGQPQPEGQQKRTEQAKQNEQFKKTESKVEYPTLDEVKPKEQQK